MFRQLLSTIRQLESELYKMVNELTDKKAEESSFTFQGEFGYNMKEAMQISLKEKFNEFKFFQYLSK